MTLFERQAQDILALEVAQKQAVLSTVFSAREEIRRVMANLPEGSSLMTHYSNLQVQFDEILSRVDPKLTTVPYVAGQVYGTELVNQSSGASLSLPTLNLQAIAAVNLAAVDKITEVNALLKSTVAQQLRVSLALGESITEASERIASAGFRRAMWRYEVIARTVTNEMANAGANSTYISLANDYPKLNIRKQWSSVLDRRTSAVCQTLNGEIQPVDKPFSLGYMYPPALPNCRSRVVSVTAKYDPTPELKIGDRLTGDYFTDAAVKEGRRRINQIPNLKQGWSDYNRVKALESKLILAFPDRLSALESELSSGKINQKQFAEAKANLRAEWVRTTTDGKSYQALKNRLNEYPEAIFQAANKTAEKELKAQIALAGIKEGYPVEAYLDRHKASRQANLSDAHYAIIRDTLPKAYSIQPQSVVRIAPDKWLNSTDSAWTNKDGAPIYIRFSTTEGDDFLRRSIIHELSHGIEQADLETLRQAVTLRDTLQTGKIVTRYGETYTGVSWYGDYGGRIYSGDLATELLTHQSEALLDGFDFFTAIERTPEALSLFLSKLDIFI